MIESRIGGIVVELSRAGRAGLLALVVSVVMAAGAAEAQQDGRTTGWGTEVDAARKDAPPPSPPAPASGWESKASPPPAAVPNTTVVPRTTPDSTTPMGEVQLIAQLTADGERIDQGIVWRVYAAKSGSDGKPRLIALHREAAPTVRLAAGEYVVNSAFGRAHLTRKVTVKAGPPAIETFVLNAGGLRVQAVLPGGGPVQDRTVSYEIYAGERNQSGERDLIMSAVKPGVVIRLNAGPYHIVSTYGDANSIVRTEVAVEAGKLTEAVVSHAAARIAFRLVERAGGEALPDTSWTIETQQGAVVKAAVAAITSHILAPGAYRVTARHGGRTLRRDFTVTAGVAAMVEVVVAE
ncbi:MAG TPA: hypothetical protein PK264_20315 [Hyphomicrobiaceae bacterium]|nr:hypothetical protein [Hyphomicrobiaceae bacterium]